jgi:hypothetical protein
MHCSGMEEGIVAEPGELYHLSAKHPTFGQQKLTWSTPIGLSSVDLLHGNAQDTLSC